MFPEIFHYVGAFVKYVGAAAVLVLSISLSLVMFGSIAPHGMPWFPWAALGLTDGGFVGWLIVFRATKYHAAHKSVAFVMIWVCLIAVLFTDAMELAKMFQIAPLFAGLYYYALIALLLGHFLALAIDELISEGQKYNYLPPSPGVAIQQPAQPQTYEQMATIEDPRSRPPVHKQGRKGRKSSDVLYAKLWYAWESKGLSDDACPWEHPSEYVDRYPRLSREEVKKTHD